MRRCSGVGALIAFASRVLDRRSFLASAAGALPFLRLAGLLRHDRQLRVATVVDAGQPDLERGLAFGAAEADRSAELFGWRVERLVRANGDAAADTDSHAVILAALGAIARSRVPVLRLVCDPSESSDGSYMLASCRHGSAHGEVWQPTLERFGAQQLNDRYRSATGTVMTGDAWLGWFAFKVLVESVLRVNATDSRAVIAYLARRDTRFDGHKGAPLYFDAGRHLVQPLYATSGASGS